MDLSARRLAEGGAVQLSNADISSEKAATAAAAGLYSQIGALASTAAK
jgi:hypothetical protein